MAIIRIDWGLKQYREISNYTILDDSWTVVTRKDAKKFKFKGKPVFAKNAEKADWPVVDIRRGIIILPPLAPIPMNIFYPGEKEPDKGQEVN